MNAIPEVGVTAAIFTDGQESPWGEGVVTSVSERDGWTWVTLDGRRSIAFSEETRWEPREPAPAASGSAEPGVPARWEPLQVAARHVASQRRTAAQDGQSVPS